MIHAPCINTVGGERDTGEKEGRGGGEKERKKKKGKREKDKPARPIRCLPIKRVAAIDFEGESTATFYKNKRSDRATSASSSPGFPCIWIKTLHISPRCKDT